SRCSRGLRPLRGDTRGGRSGAGIARRGARRARGRPRVPDQGRRLLRRAHSHLDRLQARERSRRRSAAPAPGRVLLVLRLLIAGLGPGLEIRDLRAGDWPEVAAIFAAGIETRNATFETAVPPWEKWDAARLPRPRL